LANAQLGWASSQPLSVLTTVGRSLFRYGDDYTLQFFVVREVLSGQMRFSGGAIATLQAELIVLLALGSARGGAHKARWFTLTLFLFVCVVFLQALLSSASVGPNRLQNIYGRLFFPIGPLLVAALAHTWHPIAQRWLLRNRGARALWISGVLNLLWVLLLGARFYAANKPPWKY
jgi:hypothetical protein